MRHKTAVPHRKTTKPDPELYRPDLYINREISLIAFERRVLQEAQSERHSLLERVKFLSFVSSQLDEFIMVRLAGLQDQSLAQVKEVGPDAMLPSQQLETLRALILELYHDQHRSLCDELLPRLAEAGIGVLDYAQLSRAQREAADSYFHSAILPVLTPLGVDPGHPFPHISSRSLNLAVTLRDPVAGELFARVKVPATLRRLVPVPSGARERVRLNGHGPLPRSTFAWLEQLIAAHLGQLFPGIDVIAAHPFRVLRDADLEIQSDEADDLLETVEQGLRQRRFGSAVCLMVQPEMTAAVRELLREKLEMEARDVWELEGPLGLGDLDQLTSLDRPDLKDPPFVARVPIELRRGQDPFTAIRHNDLLLHHP
ncbi:MAG: RNA degradosome polyphosphate kinase, partial [Ktedonobacterales bacterium]|nr:RNA degradosome polyphosphate kinase [Ktedonobacterales bacterium]